MHRLASAHVAQPKYSILGTPIYILDVDQTYVGQALAFFNESSVFVPLL